MITGTCTGGKAGKGGKGGSYCASSASKTRGGLRSCVGVGLLFIPDKF